MYTTGNTPGYCTTAELISPSHDRSHDRLAVAYLAVEGFNDKMQVNGLNALDALLNDMVTILVFNTFEDVTIQLLHYGDLRQHGQRGGHQFTQAGGSATIIFGVIVLT